MCAFDGIVGNLAASHLREGTVDQAGTDLALRPFIAPVADVLEQEQAQNDFGRRAQPAAGPAIGASFWSRLRKRWRVVDRDASSFPVATAAAVVRGSRRQCTSPDTSRGRCCPDAVESAWKRKERPQDCSPTVRRVHPLPIACMFAPFRLPALPGGESLLVAMFIRPGSVNQVTCRMVGQTL